MSKSNQKITLATSRDIPFNKLVLSQSNVRQIKSGMSVEELAESIARRGLIQSLHVRPVLDADGAETGMFEVPAGGRRFRALEMLVSQKRLLKSAPIPCVVSEATGDVLIDEVSLAENIERAPLHPLDQFRAFLAMREKGMGEEEIAAAFFVTPQVVKQRLKLTAVAPALLEVYAEDGMTLEQLMAFAVSDDPARQEQVWEAVKNSWSKEPYQIRRMLTEHAVRATDRRVRFIGLEVYEEAGGTVMRDLFQDDDDGWIEVATDFPYGHTHGLRRLTGTTIDLTDAERAEREALRDEYDRLEAEYADADEFPDDIDARLGEIEEKLEGFETRPMVYAPEQMAMSGVYVSLRHDGALQIERGYVRLKDEPKAAGESDADGATSPEYVDAAASDGTAITVAGQGAEPEVNEGLKPLPDRLMGELTAHRTLALRDAVAQNPAVALTALLHRLVSDTFGHRLGRGCLEASVSQVYFPEQEDGLDDSLSARSVTARHEAWEGELPSEDQALWDWIEAQDDARRMALLAHCVSFGVNALHEKPNPYGGSGTSVHGLQIRKAQADRLARATGLDMAAVGWRPTVENYLGRVTKARILEAVREGVGEGPAQLIDHLKKGDMAKEAERVLADTGWLPEPLRMVGTETSEETDDMPPETAEVASKPTDEVADEDELDAEAPVAVAAE